MLLAACGRNGNDAAVQVNRESISQQQLELLLKRPAAPGDAAARQLLERLVDQELAAQALEAQQLDRDPTVRLQLEAARREVLARVFAERLTAELPAPTAEQVSAFYREHPQLFAERKLYRMHEVILEADAAQRVQLRRELAEAADLPSFVERQKAAGLRLQSTPGVRAPEQLPAATLTALQQMQDGQVAALDTPNGLLLLQRVGTQAATLTEAQARPLIEQLLIARARNERVQAEIKRLREAARIEYRGRFASPAASAP